MDKSWIQIRNRLDPTYIEGVEKFIELAYEKKQPNSRIYCPCKKCSIVHARNVVTIDLRQEREIKNI